MATDAHGLLQLRDVIRDKAKVARNAKAEEYVAVRDLEAAVLANLKEAGIVPDCKIRFVHSGAIYFFKGIQYSFGQIKFKFKILKADGTEAIRGGSAGHGMEYMDFEISDTYPMVAIT